MRVESSTGAESQNNPEVLASQVFNFLVPVLEKYAAKLYQSQESTQTPNINNLKTSIYQHYNTVLQLVFKDLINKGINPDRILKKFKDEVQNFLLPEQISEPKSDFESLLSSLSLPTLGHDVAGYDPEGYEVTLDDILYGKRSIQLAQSQKDYLVKSSTELFAKHFALAYIPEVIEVQVNLEEVRILEEKFLTEYEHIVSERKTLISDVAELLMGLKIDDEIKSQLELLNEEPENEAPPHQLDETFYNNLYAALETVTIDNVEYLKSDEGQIKEAKQKVADASKLIDEFNFGVSYELFDFGTISSTETHNEKHKKMLLYFSENANYREVKSIIDQLGCTNGNMTQSTSLELIDVINKFFFPDVVLDRVKFAPDDIINTKFARELTSLKDVVDLVKDENQKKLLRNYFIAIEAALIENSETMTTPDQLLGEFKLTILDTEDQKDAKEQLKQKYPVACSLLESEIEQLIELKIAQKDLKSEEEKLLVKCTERNSRATEVTEKIEGIKAKNKALKALIAKLNISRSKLKKLETKKSGLAEFFKASQEGGKFEMLKVDRKKELEHIAKELFEYLKSPTIAGRQMSYNDFLKIFAQVMDELGVPMLDQRLIEIDLAAALKNLEVQVDNNNPSSDTEPAQSELNQHSQPSSPHTSTRAISSTPADSIHVDSTTSQGPITIGGKYTLRATGNGNLQIADASQLTIKIPKQTQTNSDSNG
jgi:hypothetical protein